MVQPDGDRMGADRAPLARSSAGAKVVDVDLVLDDEAGAIRCCAFLDDAFEDGRGPVRTEDFVAREKCARLLHRFPTGDFGEELV